MANLTIYIRLRQKFKARCHDAISIKKLTQIVGPDEVKQKLEPLIVHEVSDKDQKFIVIDVMQVIGEVYKLYPEAEIQAVGPTQTIIEVVPNKKRRMTPVWFVLIWLLLFIGAALAIMNFHEDVAMGPVHQKIYELVTGERLEKPLILQIPYSLGLGIGMILFFNHIFKKRFNEEPSPLEVEMFNYQQDLDQYVIVHENNKKETERDND